MIFLVSLVPFVPFVVPPKADVSTRATMSSLLLRANNASDWTGPTGNNTYLFPGPPAVLIDAGIGHPDHIENIGRTLGGAPVDLVLITHGHVDHASGVPALLERWPTATVRGGGTTPLEDGELFDAGTTTLRAIHTPGHAPDHFCFLDETTRDIYCGDLARLGGTIVIPASRGGNLADYLDSLRRIRDMKPRRLFPAHGPVVTDAVKLIDEYLQHRAQRTAEIRQALDEGAVGVDEIVSRIYPALSPRLLDAARETVRAHLHYLNVSP